MSTEVEGTKAGARGGGFGIRARLLLAFGAVAALTVLASVVAFVSYNRVGATLAGITDRNMPAMSLALTLARESAEIASTAPILAAAADKKAHDAAAATLEAHLERLDAGVDGVAG